jgi:hypothetical protein
MFSKLSMRGIAGMALALTLATNLFGLGWGNASAQSLASVLPYGNSGSEALSASGSTTVAAGTVLTINGSFYGADEPVGFWINVPSGTTISKESLGQTDTTVDGTVIPLDNMASTDDLGAFTYSFDTNGLPSGSYSLVAHGLDSQIDQVFSFAIAGSAADQVQLTGANSTPVPAGTVLTISGAAYGADEAVGLWINVPSGIAISSDSLGQTDSYIDGAVIPLDNMAYTDDSGTFSYSLDTSGLTAGSYSLVAHGLDSGVEKVFNFTISSAASAVRLTATSDTTIVAGTVLTINGAAYQADEPVGLWINVPDGTTVSSDSLGQTDSYIDGTVIPLDNMAYADDAGGFTYTVDTSGLPSGSYSLVAHGLKSGIDGVLSFTIK